MVVARLDAPAQVSRLQQLGLVGGIIFLIVFAVTSILSGGLPQLFRSYLLGFVFWNGVGVGSLAILMLQYLVRGSWGFLVRRVLEAATRTLPLTAILFIPLIFGVKYIFPWADLSRRPAEFVEVVNRKLPYLTTGFWFGRGLLYFAIWLILMYLLNRYSTEQDRTADPLLTDKQTRLSGPGEILFVLTVTFASVDWMMSLDPTWYSTIFGFIFVIGWVISAFTLMIGVMAFLKDTGVFGDLVTRKLFHDLGKLLLAFVMLWAYFSFSQFLIIWSGNLPEEGHWYFERLRGGWQYPALAIALLHFIFPFLLLLSADLKKQAKRLVLVALLLFIMRFVDLYWVAVPSMDHAFEHHGTILDLIANISAWLGFGGIWLAFFAYNLRQRPLVPLNDPHMPDVLEYAHSSGH